MAQRIVDLTLPLRPGMRGVAFEPAATIERDNCNTTNLHLYSHAGTHLDAPMHFVAGGGSVDHVALEKCAGPAQVINAGHKGAGATLEISDLRAYADRLSPGCRLLLRTGWDKHAFEPDYRTAFPPVSLALAEWLVEKGIVLLGLDTPSAGPLSDARELALVHQALLRAEIVIVESLANLDKLAQEEVYFIALPLPIEGRDGSPVRAAAIEGLL